MDNKKTIVVLFTCYKDMVSDFIYHISGKSYTHASVALEENSDVFYSFNKKGFRKENPKRYKKIMRDQSVAIYLEISEKSWLQLHKRLSEMEEASEVYHYSTLGVLACLMRIAWKRKKHYFCSQFVSELLGMTDEIRLKMKPSLYLPCQLARELSELSCVKQIKLQPV